MPRVFTAFWRRWQDRDAARPIAAPGGATLVELAGLDGAPGRRRARRPTRAPGSTSSSTDRARRLPGATGTVPAVDGTSQLSIALKTGTLGTDHRGARRGRGGPDG